MRAAKIFALARMLFLSLIVSGMASCTLPTGTRKITAWGVGCIPTGGFCLPFAGYWHSEHGDEVVGETSAKPPELWIMPPMGIPRDSPATTDNPSIRIMTYTGDF